MQTEANVRKVLDAVREADPNQDDEALSMLYDSLRWVLEEEHGTAGNFIEMFIAEI